MVSDVCAKSMSPRPLLVNLAPDVIFCIFGCCAIASVVSTAQTCRYLHQLAFHRSVWLGLLDNLRRRSILDRTCNLEALSTDEMIGIVKRLLTGPEAWSPPESGSIAEVYKQIALHPTISTGPGILHWENMAKLLPSGRYVLFNNWRKLECWSVADHKLIWTHKSTLEYAWVIDFAAEEIDVEGSVVIMLCVRTYPAQYRDRKNYVELVRLDLRAGTHKSLLVARAADSKHDNPFEDPVVCGALAVVGNGPHPHEHMVVDWKAQSYLILKNPEGSSSQLKLIPGHMMLKINEQIHIISNEALRAHLVPIVGVGDDPVEFAQVSPDDIPIRSTFVDHDREQHFNPMYVHESPLQAGTYRVWMHDTTTDRGLFRYRLQIPVHGEPQWGGRTRPSEAGSVWGHAIPYSGHTIHAGSGYTLIHPSSGGRARVNMPFAGSYFDVAPYSGTITYSTHSSIVIQYYQ